ncbi:hypothetical protein [Kitasatospora sp. MBT63]|uniref:hypothetical protein n=1 Tax=Kitasatospora sp. MBT63 TaxID=1444768 RepID=UPI00053ADFDC|nr:hypothetical protein [Kitasatospora sp. MBT63]
MEYPYGYDPPSLVEDAIDSGTPITYFLNNGGAVGGLADFIVEVFTPGDDVELLWAGLRTMPASDVASVVTDLAVLRDDLGRALIDVAVADDRTRAAVGAALVCDHRTCPYVLELAAGRAHQVAEVLSAVPDPEYAGAVLAGAAENEPYGTYLVLPQLRVSAPNTWQQMLAAAVRANTEKMATAVGLWLCDGQAPSAAVGAALAWTWPVQAVQVLRTVAFTTGMQVAAAALKGLLDASDSVGRVVWSGLGDDLNAEIAPEAVKAGVPLWFLVRDLQAQAGALVLVGFAPEQAYAALTAVVDDDILNGYDLAVTAARSFPARMAKVAELMLREGEPEVADLLGGLPTAAATELFTAIDWDTAGAPRLIRLLARLREGHPAEYHSLARALATADPGILDTVGKSLTTQRQWIQLAMALNDLHNIHAAAALLVSVAKEDPAGAVEVLRHLVRSVPDGALQPESVLEVAFTHPKAMLPTAIRLAAHPDNRIMLTESLLNAATAAEIYGGIINEGIDHPETLIGLLTIAQGRAPQATGTMMTSLIGQDQYRQAVVRLGAQLLLNGADGTALLVNILLAAPIDGAARLGASSLIRLDTHDGGDADGHFARLLHNALHGPGQPVLDEILSLLGAERPTLLTRLLNGLAGENPQQAAAALGTMTPEAAAAGLDAMAPERQAALLDHLPDATLTAMASTWLARTLFRTLWKTGRAEQAMIFLVAMEPRAAAEAVTIMDKAIKTTFLLRLPHATLTAIARESSARAASELLQILCEAGRTELAATIIPAMEPGHAAKTFTIMNWARKAILFSELPDAALTSIIRQVPDKTTARMFGLGLERIGHTGKAEVVYKALRKAK